MSRRISAAAASSILLAVLTAFIFRSKISELARTFPECRFHKLTGLLCPACGNTRSALCLLEGNIVDSFGYNAVIPIGAFILFLFWLQCVFSAFNKNIRLLTKSRIFWTTMLCTFILYLFLRNFFKFLSPYCYQN
ncbi:MAG: DUF2752 domain-containing protein [Ruminococcus sp.]|nr:DUF2752 domain-containing protein [Ruminococcus sp.]